MSSKASAGLADSFAPMLGVEAGRVQAAGQAGGPRLVDFAPDVSGGLLGGGQTARQLDQVALGGEAEDLVAVQLELGRFQDYVPHGLPILRVYIAQFHKPKCIFGHNYARVDKYADRDRNRGVSTASSTQKTAQPNQTADGDSWKRVARAEGLS